MKKSEKQFSTPIGLGGKRPSTEEEYNKFVLQTVQPGLAGLMDGSVSTLAPIFAVAFATHNPHYAFVTGIAAAVGAGISMAFAEALSDTGELTGRGRPFRRGVIIGLMTFIGGIFHTFPFLIGNINVALTVAYLVVGIELITIAYIRYRYFQMRFWLSVLQVVVGGGLVFLAGILIGQA
ncbi:MAG TPA: VIT1/CCC1 transporter family protein [Candidatus Saccharimonadales bacterium]|nr:VIT1/CCC1 transporter family protein [Candidatus Saccharimonadales bacterium]